MHNIALAHAPSSMILHVCARVASSYVTVTSEGFCNKTTLRSALKRVLEYSREQCKLVGDLDNFGKSLDRILAG